MANQKWQQSNGRHRRAGNDAGVDIAHEKGMLGVDSASTTLSLRDGLQKRAKTIQTTSCINNMGKL